jgi:hypothetical protein
MLDRTNCYEDSSIALEERPPAVIPWRVRTVKAEPDYALQVSFADGLNGRVEMREMIFGKCAGVFAQLANEQEFNRVFVEGSAVGWASGLDLAPDAMYEEIKRNGVWILR